MDIIDMFDNLNISQEKIININFIREVFRYIIAFSLAITKPNYDIAFSSNKVSEFYQKISQYYKFNNYDFIDNNIAKFIFLPCCHSMNDFCFSLEDFQNSFGYNSYVANNNISQTYFKDITNYILDCFDTPCCEEFYTGWTQEQINILVYIIEYINKNWFDIGENNFTIERENYDFFFYECKICK